MKGPGKGPAGKGSSSTIGGRYTPHHVAIERRGRIGRARALSADWGRENHPDDQDDDGDDEKDEAQNDNESDGGHVSSYDVCSLTRPLVTGPRKTRTTIMGGSTRGKCCNNGDRECAD